MSKKRNASAEQRRLSSFQFQISLLDSTEHFTKPNYLFIKAPAEYDDIVQVYQASNISESTQDEIRQALEYARCPDQAEWHDGESMAPASGNKRRFIPI